MTDDASGRKIADQAAFQRLITESRNKYRTLVDGIGDEILSIDKNLTVTSANQALGQAIGAHPREIIGKKYWEVGSGEEKLFVRTDSPGPVEKALESGRVESMLQEIPQPGNKSRYYEIRAMPHFDEHDQVQGVILVRRDVSVQIEAEKQIQEYNQRLEKEVQERTAQLLEANKNLTQKTTELEKANQDLIKLEQTKRDLTNMVIHDLKGPLSEIVANLEMIKLEPLSRLQVEILESAMLGGDEMSRMIANLLGISRMEEQRLQVANSSFPPDDLIVDVAKRYSPLANLKDIKIQTEFPDDLPHVWADYHLVERVLINLVTNAIEHTQESGRITVMAHGKDNELEFTIRDNGRGMDPELLSKIFGKFSQGAEGSVKSGSGLGLTFCKMALEAMGGWIKVTSQPGEGTSFHFGLAEAETFE